VQTGVVVFGHGVPLGHPLLAGLALRDVTRAAPLPDDPALAPLLEPFLDPYVRRFLTGLRAGETAARAGAILVWRAGAGALFAFRYAAQLRRLGLLPPDPPLILWNAARPGSPGAPRFDAAETARLTAALAGLPRGAVLDRDGPLRLLEGMQARAAIAGAEAQRRRLAARLSGQPVDTGAAPAPPPGPRLALAGAPLGNATLHARIERQGPLVLDLTGPDAPPGDPLNLIAARGVRRVYWQVDPHDDLHGWRMPDLRAACSARGIGFVDLGFVPPWPGHADLAALPGLEP